MKKKIDASLKVVLLGEPEAEKTRIVNLFIENTF